MTSQTCLLCGKTLDRIRVGSGEDFCSREHRNQYRLCRGMDRLNEVNKTSTLMHHRDLLKPLARPFGAGSSERRMPDSPGIRMMGRGLHAAPPPIPSRLVASIGTSDFLREILSAAPPEARPREFQILRQPPSKGRGRRMLRIASLSPVAAGRVRRTVRAATEAKKGLMPRVSLGVRFRLPRVPAWQFGGSSLSRPHFRWLDLRKRPALLDRTAAKWVLSAGKMVSSAPPVRDFRQRPAAPFGKPGVRPISAQVKPGSATPRETTVPLNGHGPVPATLRVTARRAQLSPSFARLTQSPIAPAVSRRIATAPFVPQEPALPSSGEEFQTK